MKRILIFTDAFSGGGAEEVMKVFAQELEKDFEVLHVTKWLGPKGIDLKSNQINLKRKTSKACFLDLYKIAKNYKPDFLFSSTGHNNMISILLSIVLSNKPKVIIRESSVASIMKNYSLKSRLYDFLLMKPLYKMADKIIAQSVDIARDLIEIYHLNESKIQIINNPVKLDPLKIEQHKPEKINLLTIGRFSKEKGYDRLLKVLMQLPNKYIWQIMGDGNLVEQIKKEADKLNLLNRIIFLGFLEEEHKLEIIRQSQLYIQTSYVEGFPNSLLQSVSQGIPAIAFNVPGGTKEIINNINGQLIEDANIDDMATAIQQIDYRQFNPKEMQEDIFHRFGVQKIMLDLKKIFHEL